MQLQRSFVFNLFKCIAENVSRQIMQQTRSGESYQGDAEMLFSQEPVPVPTIHHYFNREHHKILAHLIALLSSIFLILIHQNKIKIYFS